MSDSSTIEERLAQVERELASLKSRVKALSGPKGNWIDAISGSFKDDPEFEEIVRLGKEIRDADKPEPE
ncbi:MAG: hypothetical protein RIC55_09470 [Pirellulaceae bacterium]